MTPALSQLAEIAQQWSGVAPIASGDVFHLVTWFGEMGGEVIEHQK